MSGGHEQTIVGVANGDFDAGVSWADGLGNWEDGYNSGAFRKAADAGLVDMSNLVEIWRSTLIPEGPMVVRKALPQDVKDKVTQLTADLWETDAECAYAVAAGEAKDFVPVEHSAYDGILAARRTAGRHVSQSPAGPRRSRGSGLFLSGSVPWSMSPSVPNRAAPRPAAPARGLSRHGPPQADVWRHPPRHLRGPHGLRAGRWPKSATPAAFWTACTRSSTSRPKSCPKPGKSAPSCPAIFWTTSPP